MSEMKEVLNTNQFNYMTNGLHDLDKGSSSTMTTIGDDDAYHKIAADSQVLLNKIGVMGSRQKFSILTASCLTYVTQ